MTRKLSIMITWQFDMKRQDAIELAKIADQSGVDSFWVPEGWARDAFSLPDEMLEVGQTFLSVFSFAKN